MAEKSVPKDLRMPDSFIPSETDNAVSVEALEDEEIVLQWLDRRSPLDGYEAQLMEILEKFPDNIRVLKSMIMRPRIPPVIAAKLLSLVPTELATDLLARHALPRSISSGPEKTGRMRPAWWTQNMVRFPR